MEMSDREYHSHNSISNSGLALLASKTPAHFFASLTTPRADTPAFREGRNIHCAVLEPDRFNAQYCVMPKFDMRRTVDKQLAAEFHEANHGKTCIDKEEAERCLAIQNSVRAHPMAAALLQGGNAERSYFTNDPITGVAVRTRPDYETEYCLVDLKTTLDASSEGFARSAYAYRYHQQAAFYLDTMEWATGIKRNSFFFIAVEKSPPYAVQVFRASEAFIARGREAYREALNTYADCLQTGVWPAYNEAASGLNLPPWAEARLQASENEEIEDIRYAE